MMPITRREYVTAAGLTLIAGCQTTPKHPPTTTSTESPTTTKEEGWVIRRGCSFPADWEEPTTVTFERLTDGDWAFAATFVVTTNGERFHPTLTTDQRYRITFKSANGYTRRFGYVHNGEKDAEVRLFSGCYDLQVID